MSFLSRVNPGARARRTLGVSLRKIPSRLRLPDPGVAALAGFVIGVTLTATPLIALGLAVPAIVVLAFRLGKAGAS